MWPTPISLLDSQVFTEGVVYFFGLAAVPLVLLLGIWLAPRLVKSVSMAARVTEEWESGYEEGYLGSVRDHGRESGSMRGEAYAWDYAADLERHYSESHDFND